VNQSTPDICTLSLPESRDVLTEVLRNGAREMLARAIEAEVADWIDTRAQLRDQDGRRQVVRNGFHPERDILTGLGPITVKQPRILDRQPAGEKEGFRPSFLPPYLHRTKDLARNNFPYSKALPGAPSDAPTPTPATQRVRVSAFGKEGTYSCPHPMTIDGLIPWLYLKREHRRLPRNPQSLFWGEAKGL
jgi:hypothetical protein